MSQNTKAAWGRIRERLEAAAIAWDNAPTTLRWYGEVKEAPDVHVGSINDEIQREYRADRITEPERDAMRTHVKVWLGDPAVDLWGSYAQYACGLWAPSAAPMGEAEIGIILATVTILEEEDSAE